MRMRRKDMIERSLRILAITIEITQVWRDVIWAVVIVIELLLLIDHLKQTSLKTGQ